MNKLFVILWLLIAFTGLAVIITPAPTNPAVKLSITFPTTNGLNAVNVYANTNGLQFLPTGALNMTNWFLFTSISNPVGTTIITTQVWMYVDTFFIASGSNVCGEVFASTNATIPFWSTIIGEWPGLAPGANTLIGRGY